LARLVGVARTAGFAAAGLVDRGGAAPTEQLAAGAGAPSPRPSVIERTAQTTLKARAR
jgi:hypothetical protein